MKHEQKMETLNRSAIVVTPKQPFLDWLHATDPTSSDLTAIEVAREPTIYLIPECDTDEELTDILRELCEAVFEEQLDSWYRDRSKWPRDRSYGVFCEWFEYRHHSMLVDLSDEPLIRN